MDTKIRINSILSRFLSKFKLLYKEVFLKYKSNLVLLLCLLSVVISVNAIRLNISNQFISWYPLNELAINYQGGFTRRGLLGEIVFHTNYPFYYFNLVQRVIIWIFLIGLILILAFEKSIRASLSFTITIIFAPGTLFDFQSGHINDYLARREIWFYAVFIIFFFTIKFFAKYFNLVILVITILSILMILHHELYSIFIFSLFLTLLLVKKNLKSSRNLAKIVISLSSMLFVLILVISNHGTAEIRDSIIQSWETKFPGHNVGFGALINFAWTIEDSHMGTLAVINEGSTLYYIFFALTSLIFMIYFAINRFEKTTHLNIAFCLIFINLFLCLSAFYFFWDVGRLISMFTIMTFLSLNILREWIVQLSKFEELRFDDQSEFSILNKYRLTTFLLVTFLIFLGVTTRVEQCCSQPAQIPLLSFFGILK